MKNKNDNKKKYSYYIMGNFFYYQQKEESMIQLNSFAPTNKQYEYVVDIFPNDDDEPSLNMYRFRNKTRYNH